MWRSRLQGRGHHCKQRLVSQSGVLLARPRLSRNPSQGCWRTMGSTYWFFGIRNDGMGTCRQRIQNCTEKLNGLASILARRSQLGGHHKQRLEPSAHIGNDQLQRLIGRIYIPCWSNYPLVVCVVLERYPDPFILPRHTENMYLRVRCSFVGIH